MGHGNFDLAKLLTIALRPPNLSPFQRIQACYQCVQVQLGKIDKRMKALVCLKRFPCSCPTQIREAYICACAS